MWNRRKFLALGLSTWGLSGLPRIAEAARVEERGPRYVVVLMLRGGVDGVYAFDPKTRRDVDSSVDVPYLPNEIVSAGNLQFGPHFAALAPFVDDLAVVKGLQVKTANHESGAIQMLRLKTAATTRSPGILDIIGSARGDRPLATVTLGNTSGQEYSPAAFGSATYTSTQTILDRIGDVSAEDMELLAKVYARHEADLLGWPAGGERDRSIEHLHQIQALFGRLPHVAPFNPDSWGFSGTSGRVARDLQRVLWLIENDLTRCVFVKVFLDWDSHYDNKRKQTAASASFVPALVKFFQELRSKTNANGRLMDQTLVVAGSELARFPVLNGNEGKDHFPETTVLLAGGGIASTPGGAVYGQTGKLLEGLPISLTTGKPNDQGERLVLDDLGTTLLHHCGFDPERYGYRGRRLSFLERAV